MNAIKTALATILLTVFLVGCGQVSDYDVTPLDEAKPVPECVSIEFYQRDTWDGDEFNNAAAVYCKKE